MVLTPNCGSKALLIFAVFGVLFPLRFCLNDKITIGTTVFVVIVQNCLEGLFW